MRTLILALAVLVVLMIPARAEAPTAAEEQVMEYRTSLVRVLNNSAMMYYDKDYWVMRVSGTVGSDGIPESISLGDVINVGGQALQANYIIATLCLKTIESAGQVLCQRGQTNCVTVEYPEDIPDGQERDRLWIYVKDCLPLG